MAKIKLLVRGKQNPSTIHIRFYHGNIDVSGKTGLLVDPDHWDPKASNYKNVSAIKDRDKKHLDLEKLKLHVLEAYNDAYRFGEVINKPWLEKTVKEYYGRPVQEEKGKIEPHLIYYLQFAEWWLENKAPIWKTGKNKFLSKRAISQYESFLQMWRRFSSGKKLTIKSIDSLLIDKFVTWLEDVEGYAENTIKRHIGRLRFFLHRAETEGVKTSDSYNDRVYVSKGEEIIDPVLSEDEINRVFGLDLSGDIKLESIRDNAIIGLWSGLRISDFNHQLDVDHIKDGYIRIKTTKTGSWVVVPLHPHVKSILKKRGGFLPPKYNDAYFNKHIKTICKLADIDNIMRGRLYDGFKKRAIEGDYPKYKLISSHACRRSFTTNLYGVIPDSDLTTLGGWANQEMMRHYVKKTKQQSADNLKKAWDKKYSNFKTSQQ